MWVEGRNNDASAMGQAVGDGTTLTQLRNPQSTVVANVLILAHLSDVFGPNLIGGWEWTIGN